MFLSEQELRELTGFVRAAKQMEWLRLNGWKYAEDSQRRPKVARSYFEIRLGGSMSADRASEVVGILAPHFEALRTAPRRGRRHGA